jgi:putative SOS response-associated peptidase YedK
MPVILRPGDWSDWLDGPPDAAELLCHTYPELMEVNLPVAPAAGRPTTNADLRMRAHRDA